MDTSSNVKPSQFLHKTKSLRSLGNVKDPTKCGECKYELPLHSRKCATGKANLCLTCGRDKTYNHKDEVCALVDKNRAEWSPDTEADRHAAALRKQGDLPPTPEVESQPSLKHSNSEDEHSARPHPATIPEHMDEDDLYVPDNPTSQAPQVDDEQMGDIDNDQEDPAVLTRVNESFRHLTKESIASIQTSITQPMWKSETPWYEDPTHAAVALANIGSTLVSWITQSNMLDDETSQSNDANDALNSFHSTYRIHSPDNKHVFEDVYQSAAMLRERQIADDLSSMNRSISSLTAMVSTLIEKTNKLEKQAASPSSSSANKPSVLPSNNINNQTGNILTDPIGVRFVHDPRFPPPPPVIKQCVQTPKNGKTEYAAAIAKTRIPGSGFRMTSEGTIYAPDRYAHSAHNAP